MMNNMKVILAHPGRQHSFKVASALKKNGTLFKYVTTVYDKKNSILMRIVKFIIRGNDLKRAEGRYNRDLNEDDVIQYCQISGLIEILLSKYDSSRFFYNRWHEMTSERFGRKVAKYAIKEGADAVICYDTNALACFDYLRKKAPHIKRIMDVSAANRSFMKIIYEKDMSICPAFANKLFTERKYLWDHGFVDRNNQEIAVTQFFLVPSEFVKRSLLFSGVCDEQMYLCPYGSNFEITKVDRDYKSEKVCFLYVGNITEMKGIYYLLEAALNLRDHITLTVVGKYDNASGIFDKYIKYIKFTGFVNHNEVVNYLKEADVFVFPSLGEGLSLSVLEAMSFGLPCIVSENSGANDAIKDGENGFVIKIQDQKAIEDRMNWFVYNREKIPDMANAAIEAAKKYTWENYEKRLAINMEKILKAE